MDTPFPEVHLPGDTCSDLHGPMDAQSLREDNMGKDEGPLRVPGPPEYPSPLHIQDCRELDPYCARGRGVQAI